jgi:hypothetical protein
VTIEKTEPTNSEKRQQQAPPPKQKPKSLHNGKEEKEIAKH